MKDTAEDRDDHFETPPATDGSQVPRDAEWNQVVQTPFDPEGHHTLTSTIVFAIAEAEGVAPSDVENPPLYDVVDATALETAFFGADTGGRDRASGSSTEFMYRGHRVVVDADGWVSVHERVDG